MGVLQVRRGGSAGYAYTPAPPPVLRLSCASGTPSHLCSPCRYGEVALELFASLPHYPDGTLDYSEVIEGHLEILERGEEAASDGASAAAGAGSDREVSTMKNLLCALAWDTVSTDLFSEEEFELTKMQFDAPDAATLRLELTKMLRWHSLRLSELFDAIDTDALHSVSRPEFVRGLTHRAEAGLDPSRPLWIAWFASTVLVLIPLTNPPPDRQPRHNAVLGFCGDPAILHQAFENLIDADSSGSGAWGRAAARRKGWRAAPVALAPPVELFFLSLLNHLPPSPSPISPSP